MSQRQWSKATLGGKLHIIPQVCPNCLDPSEVEWRYAYKRPWWMMDDTRYIQTFYYCRACGATGQGVLLVSQVGRPRPVPLRRVVLLRLDFPVCIVGGGVQTESGQTNLFRRIS